MERRFRRSHAHPQSVAMMTLDELAYVVADFTAQGRNAIHSRTEWQSYHEALRAYRGRMEVENYLAHQYGHDWDSAGIHPNYADHGSDTPTGYVP